MNAALTKLDSEIAAALADADRIAAMPPTVSERFEKAAAELREAEQLYLDHGFNPPAAHPGEAEHLRQMAVKGALMDLDADKVLKRVHQRLAAAGEGLSVVDKARKLAEIQRRVRALAARRELAVRETSGEDLLVSRPHFAEMAIWRREDLQVLAH